MKILHHSGNAFPLLAWFAVVFLVLSGTSQAQDTVPDVRSDASKMFGKFDVSRDILLAQFDGRPDADDLHAQAAFGCMLRHPEFADVKVYGVHNAYGK
jgi:hypothetical protein